jgi:hypothetical protein
MDMDNLGPVEPIEFGRRSNAVGSDVLGVQVISDL